MKAKSVWSVIDPVGEPLVSWEKENDRAASACLLEEILFQGAGNQLHGLFKNAEPTLTR